MEEQAFAAAAQRLTEAAERDDGLEVSLGPLVDRLLLRKGIAAVDPECRPVLLNAFLMALQDAFANGERNAAGDYSDPKASRFPEWSAPSVTGSAGLTITALAEGWWVEAKARGLKNTTRVISSAGPWRIGSCPPTPPLGSRLR